MREELYAMATSVARGLAKRWREEFEDIRQEILVDVIQREIDAAWADADQLDRDEYTALVRRTRAWMGYAGERYCRSEKAQREGYSPEDEAFYSTRRLEELLSWLMEVGIEERPPVSRADSVQRTGDPSEGGSHMASMLDVERGLSLVPEVYRQRLQVRYGPLAKYSDDQIAALSQSEIRQVTGWHHDKLRHVLGSTGDQVRHRVDTALRRLQRELGGVNPWSRGPFPKPVFHSGQP